LTALILNAEVEMNPNDPDDLIVRTEMETYQVDFYIDKNDKIVQLDYDGDPLPIFKRVRPL